MSPKDCAYIVERLAIRFMDLVADHERQLSEHRTSFGARTEADAKIIAGLRGESAKYKTERDHFYQREGIEQKRRMDAESERDVLLTQVQNMREEIIRVNEAHGRTKVENDGLLDELAAQRAAFTAEVERIRRELCEGRDALRAEVAALQERLRASIARGDFAQMEVAARTKQSELSSLRFIESAYNKALEWCKEGQTPDDRIRELYKERNEFREQLRAAKTAPKARPFPPEAYHDTEAGKASAESAVKTEPVVEEIKVGDVVEVFQETGSCTFETDVGTRGTVLQLDDSCVDTAPLEGYRFPKGNHVSLCDVRKVTT